MKRGLLIIIGLLVAIILAVGSIVGYWLYGFSRPSTFLDGGSVAFSLGYIGMQKTELILAPRRYSVGEGLPLQKHDKQIFYLCAAGKPRDMRLELIPDSLDERIVLARLRMLRDLYGVFGNSWEEKTEILIGLLENRENEQPSVGYWFKN